MVEREHRDETRCRCFCDDCCDVFRDPRTRGDVLRERQRVMDVRCGDDKCAGAGSPEGEDYGTGCAQAAGRRFASATLTAAW